MADIRPFRALRFDTSLIDPALAIAPPYDVISPDEQRGLYARSEHNIVRVEYGEERATDSEDDNRYTRAADDLRAWRDAGMLIADRILAEATAVAGEKVQAPCRGDELIDAASTAPGIAGPTPKIPADSHIQSHSSSIPSRQHKRTGPPAIRESPHASN